MKINQLIETTVGSVGEPGQVAFRSGRNSKSLEEMTAGGTVSGGVAPVASPMGKMHKRVNEKESHSSFKGPHGELDVDRSKSGVTKVTRKDYEDNPHNYTTPSIGRDVSDYDLNLSPNKPHISLSKLKKIKENEDLVELGKKLGTKRDMDKSVRKWRKERGLAKEGIEQHMSVNDYDTWRDKVSAMGSEIHSQKDRVHLVAQSWDGDTVGEFNLKTNQGWIVKRQDTMESEILQGMLEAKLSEEDVILVPGQISKRSRGFIPHGTSRVDHEVEMAKSDLVQCVKNSKQIHRLIKDISEQEGLEGWVQEKITKAEDYLNTVREYLEGKYQQVELEAANPAQQAAIAIAKKKKKGVTEATGDPKFDKMLKGITGKRQVAKQQKTDTKQRARDAFGSMFGGGNPADQLSIRKKGVAEGAVKTLSMDLQSMSDKEFFAKYKKTKIEARAELKGISEERTETKNEKGEVISWKDESDWHKGGKNKDGRGKVTNLSDKARRETEKLGKTKK